MRRLDFHKLARAIDMDAVVRELAGVLNFPADALRTPEEVAEFRRRSVAAKKGWRRRKERAI